MDTAIGRRERRRRTTGPWRTAVLVIAALVATLMAASPVSAAAGDRYELVRQDGQYLYVVDSVAGTKTWAGHCDGQLGSARAVGWDDVKDLVQTDTPSCDVLVAQMSASTAAPTNNTPTNTPQPTERAKIVVSMGDSFISGESGHLIGNNSAENRGRGIYEAGTDPGCRRSDVAPINSANIAGVQAVNIACSGAVTGDIGTLAQSRNETGRHGERLQIHQLQDLAATNDIEMVAVSIGGNDAGFEQLTTECALAYATGSNCEVNDAPVFANRVTGDMKNKVFATVQEIKNVLAASGQEDTRIVLLSYPSPVPAVTYYDTVQRLNHGCTFKASDMRYIRTSFVPLLDATLQDVADDLDIYFLSLSDAFNGKELCSPETTGRDATADRSRLEWATGVRVTGRLATPESIHPNALGQQAIGACLGLVANSNDWYNKCYNNGGQPSDVRIAGFDEVDPQAFPPANTGTPDCTTSAADPDGDGWGWENGASCRVVISAEDVNCDIGADGDEAAVCEAILDMINDEIDGAISIDDGGVLFTWDDPVDEKINSSSCTARAYVTNKHATVRFGSAATLDVRGDSLTEPFAIETSVPIDVDLRIDGKTRLGHRLFFGSCNKLGSDSYYMTAGASATVDLGLGFDFNAEVEANDDGDLEVTIAPKATVALRFDNPDLDLEVHGVNPVAQFYAFGSGLFNTSSENLGIPALLVAGSTGLGVLAIEIGTDIVEHQAQREASKIAIDYEIDLNNRLVEEFGLVDGQRTYVVPSGDFGRLISGDLSINELIALAS